MPPRAGRLTGFALTATPTGTAQLVGGWLLLDVLDARRLKVCVGALAAGFPLLEIARGRVARYVRNGRPSQAWQPGLISAGPFGLGAGASPLIDPAAGMVRLVFGLGNRAGHRSDDDYTRVVALNAPPPRPQTWLDMAESVSSESPIARPTARAARLPR